MCELVVDVDGMLGLSGRLFPVPISRCQWLYFEIVAQRDTYGVERGSVSYFELEGFIKV